MRKRDEITNPTSCINKALSEELTFVLLGRDAAAPAAIRAWCDARVRLGENPNNHQIREARITADKMELERMEIRKHLGKP